MGPVVGVGVDLGQRHDPTALVVAEVFTTGTWGAETRFVVREFGRLPLGTAYPKVYTTIAAASGLLCGSSTRSVWKSTCSRLTRNALPRLAVPWLST